MNLIVWAIKEVIKSYTKLTVHPKNLTGKTILISGGNEGIGLETAIQLAKMNAKIIIASRNLRKSELAVEKIKQSSHNNDIHCRQLDLGSIQNVNEFSDQFKLDFPVLDILINNAGLVTTEYSTTEDGIEKTCHVNHIGPSQLAINLLPILLKSESARIINVASTMHHLARLQLPRDLNLPKSEFQGVSEYNKSKLMNILFTKELANQLKNKPIKVVCLHPGYVASQLGESEFQSGIMKLIAILIVHPGQFLFARKTDQGAKTSVYCATEDNLVSGEYYDSCKVGELDKQAYDKDLQKALWDQTLEKLKFNRDIVAKL